MKINLIIDNKEKTFIAPFISTRRLKETLALSNKVQHGFDEKVLDELGIYLVNLYGKQFTLDDLLDGFPSSEFFNKALDDMQKVIGDFNLQIKN